MPKLDQLLTIIEQAESSGHAKKNWQPGQVGEIDIHIKADGQWLHEGRPFQRLVLVKLFASVLRREGDTHYLVTPGEKLAIRVDDAPFVATTMELMDNTEHQALVFTTTLGESIIADEQHPIRVEIDPVTRLPRPYIHFRNGLDALISRSAFFDLANTAQEVQHNGDTHLIVHSMGAEFSLGICDE
ncbi:MAG: hypothetical protein ACI8XX_002604 [Polaribacter sp.]|jgi:hypothetical protein